MAGLEHLGARPESGFAVLKTNKNKTGLPVAQNLGVMERPAVL
jgi:hypothetical protein